MTTGQPIENVMFTWDVRTMDNMPLTSNRLAERIRSENGELQLFGLKESGRFAKTRCLAKKMPAADEEPPKVKEPFYASEFVEFDITRREGDVVPSEPEIGKLFHKHCSNSEEKLIFR